LTSNREISRSVVHVPQRSKRTTLGAVLHAAKGVLLGPTYWGLAALYATPGLHFRKGSFALGLRALIGQRTLSLASVFHLLFMPMESTRYFEFDFTRRALAGRALYRYLDVSSPRLLPISLLSAHPSIEGDLINPNRDDLDETRRVLESTGIGPRYRLHPCLIADAPFEAETFDVITSISVLEHIPDDLDAIRCMWSLLRPGGALVLTVPCMAGAAEQYIDQDPWGLLSKDSDGYVFWQRFYNKEWLEQKIFCVTGAPVLSAVYGEKMAGAMVRNSERKRSDPYYPYWREPYMMAKEFQYFDQLEDLPGEGVVGMLFVKAA
jgi:SAM-dependent methyltransferase